MRLSLVSSIALAALPLFAQRTAPASTSPNYYRMKKVAVVDEHGFERPMQALSLLVPTDWQFQGSVRYSSAIGCHADMVKIAFKAVSPDGRLAVEMFPGLTWQWSDDASAVEAMRMVAQRSAQFGRKECDTMSPMTPGDLLRRMVVPKVRPNARVLVIEPMPDVAGKVQAKAREYEAQYARSGMHVRIHADAARARLEYGIGGQPMEEWITAVTYAAGLPGPSYNMATGRVGQTLFYQCGGYQIFGLRAPQGQLQPKEKLLNLVLSTVQADPAWQARVTRVQLNMQAADSKGAMDRSAIIAQSGRDTSDIIKQTYENRQRSQDASAGQFSQAIRGVETYRNPGSGETIELDNQYGHAWVNNSGEYILTDSPGFDPNVALKGNWTALQHVKR